MIIDLPRFAATERPYWQELERALDQLSNNPELALPLEQAEKLDYLYRRASSGLLRVRSFTHEPELRQYLEALVARAHGELRSVRGPQQRLHPWQWFTQTFPQTFRRRFLAFQAVMAVTILGMVFAVVAMTLDPESRHVFLPFGHADRKPSERVAEEMADRGKRITGARTDFSAQLMTHNTKVAVLCMSLGITAGIGTFALLFYNGAMLGGIFLDYITDNQTAFLFGWILPHGVVELPAIFIAGQAGFVIASALLGWGDRAPLTQRLRSIGPDVATLIGGVAIMMIWAGIIESFLSQYHEPVLPYAAKIAFGLVEFTLLVAFLGFAGRRTTQP
jgi:uncharacterized membrane protein SpoIIM required for sporulation